VAQFSNDRIRKAVRSRYGLVAVSENTGCGCTESSCCNPAETDARELGYSLTDIEVVPGGTNMGLGCGNPKAIASLKPGETVLDLGSGGGFDCFLASKEVGDSGFVIGVDMTPEMIDKARVAKDTAGYGNVDFRLGEIEHLPVADGTVDVIISNCVINLSPDKEQVFREAFRVLKPGGRLAVSDIVATAELPEKLKNDQDMLTGCMAGASLISDLENILIDAGFRSIAIKPKDESREFLKTWAPGTKIEDYVVSAAIEAVKPGCC
jgi:SAM-dependent methyltransferase